MLLLLHDQIRVRSQRSKLSQKCSAGNKNKFEIMYAVDRYILKQENIIDNKKYMYLKDL